MTIRYDCSMQNDVVDFKKQLFREKYYEYSVW